MSRAGDVIENPVTGERGVVRLGTGETGGELLVVEAALFARELEDVLYFTRPPRVVQKMLFCILAPVARFLGYRGSYPEYLERGPTERIEVEPWTNAV